jgi:hypothetical protein
MAEWTYPVMLFGLPSELHSPPYTCHVLLLHSQAGATHSRSLGLRSLSTEVFSVSNNLINYNYWPVIKLN